MHAAEADVYTSSTCRFVTAGVRRGGRRQTSEEGPTMLYPTLQGLGFKVLGLGI